MAYDIIVYGMKIKKLYEEPYSGLFGNATRAFGLANNFAKEGRKTGLVVEKDFVCVNSLYVSPVLDFICIDDLEKHLSSANDLVIACTNLHSFKNIFLRNPYLYHPSKFCVCCFDNNADFDFGPMLNQLYGITFNNDIQRKSWKKRKLKVPCHVVNYGVNEFKYVDDAICDDDRISAIWIGEIRRLDILKRIVSFAVTLQECRVNVVTRKIFDETLPHSVFGGRNNPYADFSIDEDCEKFYNLIKTELGVTPPSNLFFHGSLEGENHIIMGRNSIGLDFSRSANQGHDNTKVLDYLRSGLFTICEEGTPSKRFVEDLGFGCVLPFNSKPKDYIAAIKQYYCKRNEVSRAWVANETREKFGWDVISRKVLEYMDSDKRTHRRRSLRHILSSLFKYA